jgi:threonine/homoserine/homoserine lactone efflux protein
MALAAGSIGACWPPRLGPWLDRLCGVLFIGLALRLVVDG